MTEKHSLNYNSTWKDSHTPWAGHKYFAVDLIKLVKPKVVVELGTYKGTSFFAFAEGIQKSQLETVLYGIDTWEEDSFSGKFSGEKVLDHVKRILSTYYSSVKTKLIRKTFDEAVSDFSDNSIDILHIDGWHSYDAVSNDFKQWLPKVNKESGVILFHDISVVHESFGVKQFWYELMREHHFTLEFDHSNGLGVYVLSENSFENIKRLVNENKENYLVSCYNEARADLAQSHIISREIDDIKSSKFWKLKEFTKKILGKS